MIHTRCQICGRRKGLTKAGGILFHNVRGVPCAGAGHPPLAESDAFLEAEIQRLQGIARAHRFTIRRLVDRRANYIDPALPAAARAAEDRAEKLDRRLRWHRSAPARRARQLERYGYTL